MRPEASNNIFILIVWLKKIKLNLSPPVLLSGARSKRYGVPLLAVASDETPGRFRASARQDGPVAKRTRLQQAPPYISQKFRSPVDADHRSWYRISTVANSALVAEPVGFNMMTVPLALPVRMPWATAQLMAS